MNRNDYTPTLVFMCSSLAVIAILLGAIYFSGLTSKANAQGATFVANPRVVSISTVANQRWPGGSIKSFSTTRAWSDGLTEYRSDGWTSNGTFVPGEWIALD